MKNPAAYSGVIALALFLAWGSVQTLSAAEKSLYGTYFTGMSGENSLYTSQTDEQDKANHHYKYYRECNTDKRCNKVWKPVISSGSHAKSNSSFFSNIQHDKNRRAHINSLMLLTNF
ncbi:hypothetical protein [Candidatus Nitrosacidococcus sp. I8]|uniref:hypothetical protein n=1 Tax=Candidatus Nitrosacidococcus sp. I8 TaxID=2942908 RepID=UPI002226A9D6|nr:hypothetical protein [Candidatus Nitrosacidococcus sp. I8]CAH9016796.1 hypothetical protein NURINAE_00247 [Candidatus Nitrosacidococcus sp. I8]